jgi:hypothetical protein
MGTDMGIAFGMWKKGGWLRPNLAKSSVGRGRLSRAEH